MSRFGRESRVADDEHAFDETTLELVDRDAWAGGIAAAADYDDFAAEDDDPSYAAEEHDSWPAADDHDSRPGAEGLDSVPAGEGLDYWSDAETDDSWPAGSETWPEGEGRPSIARFAALALLCLTVVVLACVVVFVVSQAHGPKRRPPVPIDATATNGPHSRSVVHTPRSIVPGPRSIAHAQRSPAAPRGDRSRISSRATHPVGHAVETPSTVQGAIASPTFCACQVAIEEFGFER